MKYSRLLLKIIFLLPVLFFNNNLFSEETKENVAVLDIKLINVSEDTGNIVRNKIEYNLFNSKKFNLLERNRIDLIRNELNLHGRETDRSGYAVEAGKLLPADYLITGEIIRKDIVYVNIVLISAVNGDIIYSFSEEYETEDALLKNTGVIANRIKKEILYNSEFGNQIKTDSKRPDYYLSLEAGYIPSAGRIGEFAEHGFMFMINAGKRDLFFKGVRIGIHGAYSHLYTENDIEYALIAPLQGTLSYEFQAYRKFFINPGFGFGTSLVAIEKNDSTMRELEACGMCFLELKYYLRRDLAFTCYGNYYTIFETGGNIDLYSIGGGLETLY